MKKDANRLLSIVQEHWVDDGDEAEMMRIIEYYAQTPEAMEAFFGELDNHHYWGGIFDEEFTPLITALKRELEGGNGRRFMGLMNKAKSERIQNYEDPEEVTFSGVLWDDVKTGAAADRIVAFGKGFGGAALDTAKGIGKAVKMLATDPVGFGEAIAKGAANLPGNVVEFFKSAPERWRDVEKMSPEEQARAIGRITFEAEMLITDVAGATAAAKGASKWVGKLPDMPLPSPGLAMAVEGGGRIAAGAGDAVIDLSKLGPGAGVLAGGAVVAPELAHLSSALDEVAEGSGGGGRGGAAARSSDDILAEFGKRKDVQSVLDELDELGMSLDEIGVPRKDLATRLAAGTPQSMKDAARYLREKLEVSKTRLEKLGNPSTEKAQWLDDIPEDGLKEFQRQVDLRKNDVEFENGRSQARRNIEKSGTPVPDGAWEAHHIIPWEFRAHPVITELRGLKGWDHNALSNTIPLRKPGKRAEELAGTVDNIGQGTAHRAHSGQFDHAAYNWRVNGALEDLHSKYIKGNLDGPSLGKAMDNLIAELRADILSGRLDRLQ